MLPNLVLFESLFPRRNLETYDDSKTSFSNIDEKAKTMS